ncbi:hypothetical protein BAUCODRAFT_150378 [Baudoinia panamericana UAMH 10762]|uniref:F-box domain-containing protein n=1 Tax=Baudoinia panamericana (strain UAMH 10762) TaxID=717646 RepID=M2N5X3_BAUPA|nr:uncharacterized protein BAUCODRAFT_150378 [Baudoinia panamericana UAMH 10762]EMC94175.1 hypothetical protein BAUCODRAFT_150378 [Baudoinia panamericana UAMH 10762]
MTDATVQSNTFRFFDLPAELREQVYHHVLAPTGDLTLTSTKSKPFAIRPVINLGLLRSCRLIDREANGVLYNANEVCIVLNAHDTYWPTISERRLPQAALQKIRHLSVILDCTEYFNASYADVDFDAFNSLTALRTLRIAMVYRKHYATQKLAPLHIATLPNYNAVAQILERIPASTTLYFGSEVGSQQHDVVLDLIEDRISSRGLFKVEEAPAADLEAAAKGVPGLVRGCKSGIIQNIYLRSTAVLEKFELRPPRVV